MAKQCQQMKWKEYFQEAFNLNTKKDHKMKHIKIISQAGFSFIHKEDAWKKFFALLLIFSFATTSVYATKKTVKYTIKRGDSLSKIAYNSHTTVAKIQKANGLKKDEILKIGRVLNVPGKSILGKKKKSLNKTLLATVAKTKLGKRYVWGASGLKNTYDCSSFTKYVYRKNGITIPRTSINQSKYGRYVKRSNLKKGDLIFFDTSKKRKGYVNHVGIYLGNNKFIHASSAKKKVVITSLNKKFYSQRYKGARRPL